MGDKLESVTSSADGTRQEADSRDKVMHSEMSDW